MKKIKLKHIQKKFSFQRKDIPTKPGAQPKMIERFDGDSIKEGMKSGDIPFIVTTEGYFIRGMYYKKGPTHTILPIPDITLVYFDFAYNCNFYRKEYEQKVIDKLKPKEEVSEDVINEVYQFFGNASSCIISLFTAMESFSNSIIPDNGVYIKKTTQKTETYDKKQIERFIGFDDKIKKVLPYFNNSKSFYAKQTPVNQHLTNLKKLRDEIVHTKSDINEDSQMSLMNELLKFKYDETIDALMKFMNFYKPDYIIQCSCGKDF